MNKRLTYLIVLCFFSICGCRFSGKKIDGNGNIISEKRSATNISKIKLEGGINVIIDNGLAAARVEADENIVPYIVTENDGDWLDIKVKDNVSLHSSKPMTVYVSIPSVTEIKIAGSGNVSANGKFSSNNKMSFEVTGSGKITMDVNAPEVKANVAGSGTIHISGQTRTVLVTIAGSGGYEGADLKAEDADINIAGSGDAAVFADVNLKASIAGSGNIKYTGNATVDKHISGSGEVIKAQ